MAKKEKPLPPNEETIRISRVVWFPPFEGKWYIQAVSLCANHVVYLHPDLVWRHGMLLPGVDRKNAKDPIEDYAYCDTEEEAKERLGQWKRKQSLQMKT